MNDEQSIHTAERDDWDIIVVGAGIAGLTAAVTAAEAGRRTLVFEAHGAGGRARTTERAGYSYNIGPHALYRAGHLSGLLRRLGIELPGGQPDAVNVRLLRDGDLTPLSLRPTDIMTTPLLGLRDRARLVRILAQVQRAKPDDFVGRSVADWLGNAPQQVAQFVEMLVRLSTYANGSAVIDAGATIAQLQLGLRGVEYLDHGWQSIVTALTSRVVAAGGVVETDALVAAVESDGGRVTVHLPWRTLTASSVVIAAGGPEVASRLTGVPVAGAENLTAPVEAASLDLALNVPRPGLVLGLDRPLYLSPHAPTARLAPEGGGLVTALRYVEVGTEPGDPRTSRDELREFASLSGISPADVVHERYLHRSVVVHGAPSAAGGGMAGRPTVDALDLAGVYLAGDWVGPSGMLADAAAASGESAAIAAVRHCASVPA